MIFNKRGAMFGLDARIALAIFGALSVISGAALYSAIQDARVTAMLADLEEVGKATTQYLLDTGSYPPNVNSGATGDGLLVTERLLSDNSITGWNGPYISYSDDANANDGAILHTSGELLMIAAMKTGTWDNVVDATDGGPRCEQGDATCAVFACLAGQSDDIQAALEEKVDGASGAANTGKVRYVSGGDLCVNVMTYSSSNSAMT